MRSLENKTETSRNARFVAAAVLAMFGLFVVFAASSCGGKSEASTSQPAPALTPGSASRTIVAAGDIACQADRAPTVDECAQSAVARRIAKIDPAAVLLLGDLQYDSGAFDDFRTSFGKSWGGLRRQWRPTVGNHEYITPGAAGYFKFFNKRAGNAIGNYSFDLAGWHFISLNSNCGVVSCVADSRQGRWLKRDLAQHSRTKCIAAFWHAPMFSSGGEHGNYPAVGPLWHQLQKARAELVLSGHDHDYERFAPQNQDARPSARGIRQFVVGTGGRSHYEFGAIQPNSQVRIADRFGALELKLTRSTYRWKFVATSGQTLDRGAARCH
jgi:hypothetical protein